MITSIGNAAVWVADLERAERFYVGVLGLDVIARIDTPQVRELIVGRGSTGTHLMLATPTATRERSATTTSPPTTVVPEEGTAPSGYWKTFLWSDDVTADVKRAAAAGIAVVQEPQLLDAFGVRIAAVADPDGHLVEIGQLNAR